MSARIETIPEEDIEAPKNAAIAFTGASNSFAGVGSTSGSIHDPVFLAKVILRKVSALLSSDDDKTSIIKVLRDIIIGTIWGMLSVSVLIFLDHRNIIHLQSAHSFRNAAFDVLNTDPETIANLEESSDLKFMTLDQYESHRKDIGDITRTLKYQQVILERRIQNLEEKTNEIDSIRDEYKIVMNHPLLELDKYCGECSWYGPTTCDERVQFLQDNNNRPVMAAKMSVMETPSCKGVS